MKTDPRANLPRARLLNSTVGRIFGLIAALIVSLPGFAHNLDTRATGIFFDQAQLTLMGVRASSNQQLVQVGDKFWIIIKTTPTESTTTGVGGYQTFYVPPGVKVLGAAYVLPVPTTTDPRGFIEIPMKGQSPIAIGDGPIGAKTTSDLIGLTLPGVNGLGINNAPVSATGLHRGTIAGVYADTGIFYSTDPRTAFYTYQTTPAGSQPVLTNNSGDPVGEFDSAKALDAANILGVTTLWDAYQEIGYGSKAPSIAIVDPVDQRGNAPWGLASAVAGPQSGYAWEFDYAAYQATSGTKLQKVQAAIKIGPWNRIQYPGSQISKDQAGLISSVIGYAGVNASTLGYDLNSPSNFLERQADGTGVNAIRFAIGQLEADRPEYSAVQIEIVQPVAANCYRIYSDAFGGDAGGTDNGKDHIWRYFDPSVVFIEPCVQLQKVGSKAVVAPGETFSYQLVFANNGSISLPNITLTDVLPSGLSYVSAVPAPTTVSSGTLTWNIGTVAPNSMVTITVTVKATGTGTQCNSITAKSGTTSVAVAEDCTEVGLVPLLVEKKTLPDGFTSVAPGGTVPYTITVSNIGSGPTGVPVVVTDYLPAGFTYQNLVSATLNGAVYSPVVGGTTAQPTFTVNQGIAAGKQLVIKFNALVGAAVSPGTYCNGVELAHDGIREGPISEACVTVGGGQIGDTVFRDWNGNGVQDSGEEGMPGVTVILADYGPNGVIGGGDDGPTRSTATDANGKYLFTGLPPSNYLVSVPAPGAGGVPSSYTLTAEPDGNIPYTTTAKTLAANEVFLAADWGYQPGGAGSIGDQVFNDINGDGVFNGTDVGIPNVVVALYEDSNGNGGYDPGSDALVTTTTTSVSGTYSFTNLPLGGNYLVYVAPTDPGLDAFFPTPYAVTTPNPHSVLNLAGAYTAADIGWIANLPSTIGDTVYEDVNGNGVYDSGTDNPLANITVTLYRDSNHDGTPDGAAVATTQSNASGFYQFTGLAPDGYIAVVDTTDSDLPPGLSAGVSQYVINLPANTNYDTADFPFEPLLSKSVNLASATVGQTLTYTIVPQYPGPGLLSNAQVIDPLPAGVTYVADSANASGAHDGNVPGTITWNLGSNTDDQPGTTPASGTVNCPGTLTLNPDSDTYIDEESTKQSSNFGGQTTFLTSVEKSKRKVGLLHFNLSTLPVNAVITSAKVQLTMSADYAGAADKPHYVEVRELLTAFGETTATWDDPNGVTAGTWADGADFSSSDYGAVAYGGVYRVPAKKATASFDVTALVNKWRTAGSPNWGAGMVYLPTGTSENKDASWYSRTGTTPPKLVIEYTVVSLVACNGTVNESAAADTYVVQDDTKKNFGTSKTLLTSTENNKSKVTLVRFNLTGIPSGAAITSVTLNLNVTAAQNSHTDSVYEMTTSWTETGATWQKKDGSANWASGNFSSSDYNGTAIGTVSADSAGAKTLSNAALITLVEQILAGNKLNLGLALVTTAGSKATSDAAYGSRENDTVANRPTLSIAWELTPSASTETKTELHVSDRLIGGGSSEVQVEMLVSSPSGALTSITPPANLTVSPGVATVTKISGPTPAGPVNLAANEVGRFVYKYSVTPGESPTSVSFLGKPTAGGGVTFNNALSEGIRVTPALTFQATVNSPLPVSGLINNTAELVDSDVGLDEFDSATTATGPSVGDFVWADLDGDGVQDSGEPGIPNVRVFLDTDNDGVLDWTDANDNGVWDSGEGEQWTTTGVGGTSATGNYRIYGLTAGTSYNVRYDFSTVPPGYAPSTALKVVTGSLGATQQFSTADFGLVPPLPGDTDSTIGDTVWLDSNNNGAVDGSETGIADVDVQLWVDLNNNNVIDGTDYLLKTQTTDASGNYLFGGLNNNNYIVKVDTSDPQFPAGTALVSGGSPITSPPANGVWAVDITANNTTVSTADFGYNYTGTIGDFVWYDTNGDGIQNENPLSGAPDASVVLVVDSNGNGQADPGEIAIGTYVTDSTGYYIFNNLPPGQYVVQMSEQEVPSPVSGKTATMVQTTGGDKAVTLTPGSMTNLAIDFGLQEVASLEGHVFHDKNHNGVLDASPTDIVLPNVTVNLYGPGPDGVLGTGDDVIVKTTTTNGSGEYSFLVIPGNYRIEYVTTDSDIPLPIRSPNGDSTTPLTYTVTALAGIEYHGFDFGRDNSGKIGDTIFADAAPLGGVNGQPGAGDVGLSGVTVNLYLDSDGNGTGDTLLDTQVTDANGKYQFVGLEDTTGPAKYLIQVNTATVPVSYSPTPSSYPTGAVTATSSYSTALTGGQTIDIVDFGYQLTAGTYYSVSGRVWNDQDGGGSQNGGEPGFNNVTVTISVDADGAGPNPPVVYTLHTDSLGDYSLPGVPAGALVVITVDKGTLPNASFTQTADPDGVKDSTNSFTMPAANVTGKNFGYQQVTGSIAGTVSDGNGNGIYNPGIDIPLAGATISLRYAGADGVLNTADDVTSFPSQVTGAGGTYSFTGLLAGLYQITETNPAGYVSLADADGGNPDNITVTLDFGPDGIGGNGDDRMVKTAQDFEDTRALSVIGDYIWLDENGDGVQDAGESGIGNVGVSLYDISTGSPVLVATTVTDSEGGYLFTGLKPNNAYRVIVDTATLPAGLAANQTYDPDVLKNSRTDVTTPSSGEGVFTADFGYNWAPTTDVAGGTGTGSIGDRVWIDADGDGKQDPGEPGLGGVPVTLITAGPDGLFGTGDDVTYASTTSGADGSYNFDNLPAGAYVVQVNGGTTPTGYTQTGDPDATTDNATTAPIILAPGDVFVNADFGYQPTPGTTGIVSGTVWLDANANAQGPAGTPGGSETTETVIPDVTVALIKDLDGDGIWDAGEPIIASTVTDAAGNYSFSGLPVTDGAGTDDYLVWVNDTGSVLTGLKQTFDANGLGTPNVSAASDLTVAGNDLQDFGYTPLSQTTTTGLIGDTIFLDTNGSGTFDAPDEALEGVTVQLYASDGTTLLASTTSNENGNYWFGGLAAGNYVVKVVTTTLPNAGVGLIGSVDPDGGNDNQSAVSLTTGQINLLQDFGYKAGDPHTISGTVWNDTNANGDLGAGETGRYAGVTVVLRDSNGNVVSTTVTDASGNYSFPGLPNGTYSVDVTDTANVLNGLWHSSGNQSQSSDGTSKNDPYTVVLNGADVPTADFGYYGAPASLGNFVWNDKNGNGIQDDGPGTGLYGAEVVLTITWHDSGGAVVSTTVVKTTTDANGFYSFQNLLLDENNVGGGAASEPTFVITVPSPGLGETPSPLNQGTAATDSNNPNGTTAAVTEGSYNDTYDFGYTFVCTAGNFTVSWGVEDNTTLNITISNPHGLSKVTPYIPVNIGTITVYASRGVGGPLVQIAVLTSASPLTSTVLLPVGTKTVVTKATRIDPHVQASYDAQAFDMCGQFSARIDPVVTRVEIGDDGKLVRQVLTDIPSFEHYLTVNNGKPGLRNLRLIVNGNVHDLSGLSDGQSVYVDIGPAMKPGTDNLVVLEGEGGAGAYAVFSIGDSPMGGDGSEPVQVIVPGPTLLVERTATGLELSWSVGGEFELQSLDGLAPGSVWARWTGAPVKVGDRWIVQVPAAASGTQFFRLHGK